MRHGWKITALAGLLLCAGVQGVFASRDWKELQSRHFIVYYKQTPIDFVRSVLETAEHYYDQIKSDLGFVRHSGWDFNQRAKIYIYDNQNEYIESSRHFGWSAGTAYTDRRMIKTYPSATGFFDSLLPHELGHIIFREFIGVQHLTVPRWFDEGVAMYQEKGRRWGAHDLVRLALQNGTFIPLDRLSRLSLGGHSAREDVELFYAQAASAVYFLIQEQGEFRFLTMCRHMRNGSSFEKAFESAYPHIRTISRFSEAWVAFLKK